MISSISSHPIIMILLYLDYSYKILPVFFGIFWNFKKFDVVYLIAAVWPYFTMPLAQDVGCATCPSATLTMSMPPWFGFGFFSKLNWFLKKILVKITFCANKLAESY